MAIILPNMRNALGVPNRYSDLASAGLRLTPPETLYTYDAYDIAGDTVTLYQEDIDLADYQYNEDGLELQVLPAGYKAISGNGASGFPVGQNNHLAIDGDDHLLMYDYQLSTYAIIDSTYSWLSVSGFTSSWSFDFVFGYAIRSDHTLWAIGNTSGGVATIAQVGSDSDWESISGASTNTSVVFLRAFGIRSGMLHWLSGTTASRLGNFSTWTAITGCSGNAGGVSNPSQCAFGIASKNLYIIGHTSSDPVPVVIQLDGSGDWERVSGMGVCLEDDPDPYDTEYGPWFWQDAYGLRGDKLMRLVGKESSNVWWPLYEVVDLNPSQTWHNVWRMSTGSGSQPRSTGIAISMTPIV